MLTYFVNLSCSFNISPFNSGEVAARKYSSFQTVFSFLRRLDVMITNLYTPPLVPVSREAFSQPRCWVLQFRSGWIGPMYLLRHARQEIYCLAWHVTKERNNPAETTLCSNWNPNGAGLESWSLGSQLMMRFWLSTFQYAGAGSKPVLFSFVIRTFSRRV